MSNQYQKNFYNNLLDSTEKETSQLEKEILILLEKPVTKEEIEIIKHRLKALEKILYESF